MCFVPRTKGDSLVSMQINVSGTLIDFVAD